MPPRVHPMRGPKGGTATSSGQRSALSTAWWWRFQHDTWNDRTPGSRMLPSVIGSILYLNRYAHRVTTQLLAIGRVICNSALT
jgi:hypothetical protein